MKCNKKTKNWTRSRLFNAKHIDKNNRNANQFHWFFVSVYNCNKNRKSTDLVVYEIKFKKQQINK